MGPGQACFHVAGLFGFCADNGSRGIKNWCLWIGVATITRIKVNSGCLFGPFWLLFRCVQMCTEANITLSLLSGAWCLVGCMHLLLTWVSFLHHAEVEVNLAVFPLSACASCHCCGLAAVLPILRWTSLCQQLQGWGSLRAVTIDRGAKQT